MFWFDSKTIMKYKSRHLKAIFLALLVTFLWSTSFVIIKWGLKDIQPLTFAGLRYSIAFLSLLPFLFLKKNKLTFKNLRKKQWLNLILLGILFYTVTQGTQYIGLSLLPAVTVSLWLNFTPFIVAITATIFISEYPDKLQWAGIILFMFGIIIYFFPVSLSDNQTIGLFVMTICVLSNASSAVLGRSINKEGTITPQVITVVSMGTGSVILLIAGLFTEDFPSINSANFYYLLWLALINTALAFTIWNYTLKTLTAMESSIINGTMLIQITVLAWIFLAEQISFKEAVGMLVAVAGAVIVQLKFRNRLSSKA